MVLLTKVKVCFYCLVVSLVGIVIFGPLKILVPFRVFALESDCFCWVWDLLNPQNDDGKIEILLHFRLFYNVAVL